MLVFLRVPNSQGFVHNVYNCAVNVLCLTESARRKRLPYCIKEFAKQLSKNALQTTKDILKSKPFKNDTRHSTEYWDLKNNSILKCHGNPKEI